MAKEIAGITVTLSYNGPTDTWTVGSNQIRANDPTQPAGSFENKGASTPYNNIPQPNFNAQMNAWLTALVNAAKAQQNIP